MLTRRPDGRVGSRIVKISSELVDIQKKVVYTSGMRNTQEPGKCQEIIQKRVSVGIMSKGTESYASKMDWCSRNAVEGSTFCKTHKAQSDKRRAAIAARRNAS